MTEAVKVLDRIAEVYGHECEYTQLLMGGASIDVHGIPLTDETIRQAKKCDAILMGSIGGDTQNFSVVSAGTFKTSGGGASKDTKRAEFVCKPQTGSALRRAKRSLSSRKEEIIKDGFDLMIIYVADRRTLFWRTQYKRNWRK